MNQLERRYRLVLRLLPVAYRRQWEEDMVDAFLLSMVDDDPEQAEFLADFGRPSWSEIASVAWLAVKLHCGLAGGRSPQSDTRVDAARIVVLLWLLFGATWAVVAAGVQLWIIGALPILPAPPSDPAPPIEPWRAVLALTGLVWLVAYVAQILGHSSVTRIAALIGVALSAVGFALGIVDEVTLTGNLPALSLSMLVPFGVDVFLLSALWTFAPRWSRVRPAPWSLALIGSIAVCTALTVGAVGESVPWWALDPVNIEAVTILAIVVVRLSAGASPSWSLALAVLVWGVLAIRVGTLFDVVGTRQWAGFSPTAFALAEVIALLIAAVPTTLVAIRAQSRLAPSA